MQTKIKLGRIWHYPAFNNKFLQDKKKTELARDESSPAPPPPSPDLLEANVCLQKV